MFLFSLLCKYPTLFTKMLLLQRLNMYNDIKECNNVCLEVCEMK
jgi:hypothetical protein